MESMIILNIFSDISGYLSVAGVVDDVLRDKYDRGKANFHIIKMSIVFYVSSCHHCHLCH